MIPFLERDAKGEHNKWLKNLAWEKFMHVNSNTSAYLSTHIFVWHNLLRKMCVLCLHLKKDI